MEAARRARGPQAPTGPFPMRTRPSGFTLLELAVVLIVLATIALVAAPQYVELADQNGTLAARAVASAIGNGTRDNAAARAARMPGTVTVEARNVCASTVLQPFAGGGVTLADPAPAAPSASTTHPFLVSGTGDCSGSALAALCTITAPGTGTATATVHCAR